MTWSNCILNRSLWCLQSGVLVGLQGAWLQGPGVPDGILVTHGLRGWQCPAWVAKKGNHTLAPTA